MKINTKGPQLQCTNSLNCRSGTVAAPHRPTAGPNCANNNSHTKPPGHKPHTIATVVVVAPTVALITLRPGAVRAAGLKAERHVADGVVLRILQATVTQQPGFQIASVLDDRSWINCRQRHRLKQCLGSHQAQYDISVQYASSSSVVLVRAAMYVWNRCTNAALAADGSESTRPTVLPATSAASSAQWFHSRVQASRYTGTVTSVHVNIAIHE